MAAVAGAFDVALVLGILWIAWRCLATDDAFEAVVLFVSFGLLLSLAWARLEAPDVALAEAALGSGFTGALLLAALPALGARGERDPGTLSPRALGASALAGGLAVALVLSSRGLAGLATGLGPDVARALPATGVAHPVTAVLLDTRGYDTLLEMAVLMLAVLGAWTIGDARADVRARPAGPILLPLVRIVVPVLLLLAGLLLWRGSHAPGGAFPAGAVAGAGGVLLVLAGFRPLPRRRAWALRLALAAGLSTFIAVALAVMAGGGALLDYPSARAGLLILAIETAATVAIGATLTALLVAVAASGPDTAASPP